MNLLQKGNVNILLDVLPLIVTVIVAIWGIWQTFVTKRLEQQVYRLNLGLDQSLQILHRAREAVIKIHGAYIFLLQYWELQEKPDETYRKVFAEKSVHEAEIKGIAFAIGDRELLNLINKEYANPNEKQFRRSEAEIRGHMESVHARITQLIEATTKK